MNAHLDWLGGFDPERREAFQRSLTVGTAGTVLLQTTISRVVQLVTLRSLGVQSTLPRKPGSGDGWYSQRRSAATTGAEWVDDTTEPTESEGSYTQVKFGFKTLLGRVKITRKLVAQGRSYGDVMAIELTGKAEDFAEQLEATSLTGDTAADANQIDGLLTLISETSGQTIANTNSATGDALFLDKLDNAIQITKGSANKAALRIYGSFKGQRLVNNALQAQQRFMDVMDIEAGFVVASYSGIAVIETTSMPDIMTYNPATPRLLAFTGGVTTALVIVNTVFTFYVELTPMTVLPLAKKSSQFDEVDMFLDIVLVIDNPKGATILAGLA